MAKERLCDSFGRVHNYLRVSLTQSCNFKCGYCVAPQGHGQAETIPNNDIYRLIRLFAKLGVDKVRLTGGEPTIRKDLVEIVGNIKEMPGIRHIGITTNGFVLHRSVKALAFAGLNSANISLDSLVPGKFAFITKVDGFKRVWQSFETAVAELETVKLNCVVMNGFNEDELCDFVEIAGKHEVSVRFIEYMPFPGNQWSLKKFIGIDSMKETIEKRFKLQPANVQDRIADYYSVEGQSGVIGFIPSISKPFCSACNRLRLTADGALKVCLHDNEELVLDLRKSDEELTVLIKETLMRKKEIHAPALELQQGSNRVMSSIGG